MRENVGIKYTAHAEKRPEERFISKQDVENGIRRNEWEAYGDKEKVAAEINGKEIELVFKPGDNKAVVVTVYWR